ncbi:MAG TPA: DUF2891 family protein, partial [Gemmatimonadaceae bacterium]
MRTLSTFAFVVALACFRLPAQQPTTATDRADVAQLLQRIPNLSPPTFDEPRALWLGTLPLSCLDRLQSRPTGRANSGAGYFWVPAYRVTPDHDRLRAFWGCGDWHSAVASTWVAVRTLKTYPNSTLRELTREKLNAHLGKSNLEGEIAFFHATAAAINP